MKGIKRADIGDMEHANSDRYEKRHVVIFDKQNVGEFLLLEKIAQEYSEEDILGLSQIQMMYRKIHLSYLSGNKG